jgi:glycosyltransferase involved in cell wall biosynthesis
VTASRPDLSRILPTYNERDRLAELVNAAFAACASARVELELIVVDDNSPDGTGRIADELAATRRMRVVHRSGKLGLGTAVVAGFAAATSDLVGVMDADFSHPPSLVPKMLSVFHAPRRTSSWRAVTFLAAAPRTGRSNADCCHAPDASSYARSCRCAMPHRDFSSFAAPWRSA